MEKNVGNSKRFCQTETAQGRKVGMEQIEGVGVGRRYSL